MREGLISMDLLTWVQRWYLDQCDGEWEHEWGVKIDTLDNPGWCVTINLAETQLEDKSFEKVLIERSESDWYTCKVESNVFEGDGGAENLSDILSTFRLWVLNDTTTR